MRLHHYLLLFCCLTSTTALANCSKEIEQMNAAMDNWAETEAKLNQQYKQALKQFADLQQVSFSKMLIVDSKKIIRNTPALQALEHQASEKSQQLMRTLASGNCKNYAPLTTEMTMALAQSYRMKIKHFQQLIEQH